MILDAFWLFTGGTQSPGNSDGATDSPTTGTQVSSNVIDIGISSGIPSSANGGGARDLGIGDDPALKILVQVTVAFTIGTNIQVNLQGAPDNGSGAAGSYATYITGNTILEAQLVAGARLMDIDFPRTTIPATPKPPRFLQLQYVNSGSHSTGKLEGVVVLDRMDQPYQANATMGGYPAGVTIAN